MSPVSDCKALEIAGLVFPNIQFLHNNNAPHCNYDIFPPSGVIMQKFIFFTFMAVLTIGNSVAQVKSAKELYEDLHPSKKAEIQKQFEEENISEQELSEIDIQVDPVTKNINVEAPNDITRKHALFVALRLGFPILAGVGIIYRNQGVIPFNVTLNAQTVILASSYNAGIAWNFYKGFFIGATAHLIKSSGIFGESASPRIFGGPQVGYQHAFGKTERWYIDGRAELLFTGDKVVPNFSLGLGVRFW